MLFLCAPVNRVGGDQVVDGSGGLYPMVFRHSESQ